MHINNLIAVGLILFAALLVFLAIKHPRLLAQAGASAAIVIAVLLCVAAAPASRDYVMSTIVGWPAASENGTNSVIFKNKAGTNWWGLDPTNARVGIRWWGTNFTGITWTNIDVSNPVAGAGKKLTFKNGLLVEVINQP